MLFLVSLLIKTQDIRIFWKIEAVFQKNGNSRMLFLQRLNTIEYCCSVAER